MLKAYKYRIYPDNGQKVQIAKTFGCCRFVYNQTLAYRKEVYEKEKKYGDQRQRIWRIEKRAQQSCLPQNGSGTLKNIKVQTEWFSLNARFYIWHPDGCRYQSASSKKRNDPSLGFSGAAGSNR